MRLTLLLAFAILCCTSCTQDDRTDISFYHWKSNAIANMAVEEALSYCQSKKIHLHYFDVVLDKKKTGPIESFPTYVLQEVDTLFKNLEIIPVVFITNEVFLPENSPNVRTPDRGQNNQTSLHERVVTLVRQISKSHFIQEPSEIQIDCDWTEKSRDAYFDFLTELSKSFKVSATIRLHQIKYPDRTGVPPVHHGTLMLYNMGDLKDMRSNSIIDPKIVKDYIGTESSYPIPIDVALPLFSQTVIENLTSEYRLIDHVDRSSLETDPQRFLRLEDDLYRVLEDTLYEGFFLNEGFHLKLEEPNAQDILESYRIIEASQLRPDGLIFYHLDENVLKDDLLRHVVSGI